MKRLLTIAAAAVLLTACSDDKYDSENDKLRAYTENTAKAIRVNLVESVEGGGYQPEEFREAIPYIKEFKLGIDENRLSEQKSDLYYELVEGLKYYEPVIKASEKGDAEAYEQALKTFKEDTAEFLSIASEHYDGSKGDTEYVSVNDMRGD